NGFGTWCARAIPCRQRAAAPAEVTSAPANRIEPASGRCEPAITLSRVVLPAPLGPTMPTASTTPTEKYTPSSTTSAPNRFLTPTAASSAVPSDSVIYALYAFSLPWIGTFGSSECSQITKSSGNLLPFFCLTHWPPMIGVVTTGGTGLRAPPVPQWRRPDGVITLRCWKALATAVLSFGLPLFFSTASATSKTDIVAPSCWFHWRPVFFV